MSAWATSAWKSDAWFGTAWFVAEEAAVSTPTGGWDKLSQFDDHIQKKRREDEEQQQIFEQIREIESPVDSEIARILQADAKREQTEQRLADLEQLVARNFRNEDLPKVKAFSEKVARAFIRANVQGNFSAIQAFERELERAIEEDEFLLMALIMLE